MSSWPRAGGGRTPCPEPPPPPPPAPPATRRRRTGPAASPPRGGCPGHAATMLIRHGAAPHARSKPFPYAKIPTLFSACASLLHFPSSLPGRAAGAPLGTKPMAGANQPGSWIIQPSGSHSSTPSTHLFFLARTALFLREHESCALKCKKLSLTFREVRRKSLSLSKKVPAPICQIWSGGDTQVPQPVDAGRGSR